MGRVALLPLGDRGGKLTVKVPSSLDVTYYMIVFETADGKLEAKELTLAVGKTYTWSVKAESGTVSYVVNEGATAVAKLSSPQANIKSFGFASTVRYKGNESDLLATFDPQ